jgi:tetratricopeptide (TPR) repeat protein
MHSASASPSSPLPAHVVYHCKICGIESSEPTCFAAIAKDGPYRLQGTCITCNQPEERENPWRRVVAWLVLIAFPPAYLSMTRGTQQIGFVGLMVIAAFMEPFIMVMHEFGHAFTARALGLKVTVITLGGGRFLWAGDVFGIPIRLYMWPLGGLTHLGGQPARLIRTRVWLTTLMGPTTNIGLAFFAILLWMPLAQRIDSNVTVLWIAYNALMAAGNLWPNRYFRSGRLHQTDGMQLLRIPFQRTAELAEGLRLGSLGPILVSYNDGEYQATKGLCTEELQRSPENPWLIILLSACHTNLGDYESAYEVVRPLLDSNTLEPVLHAAIHNNAAVALWLRDITRTQHEHSLSRAAALSEMAYVNYPCVLAYRSTRALLLAAGNRAQDALGLLEYMNYDRGTPDNRSHREIARAFALRHLNRNTEAEQALAAGLKLTKKRLPWLTTIGLVPAGE